MLRCSDLRLRCLVGGAFGQATVEAALLIPVLCIAALLVLQPSFILFGRLAMQASAADGCRVLETLEPGHEAWAKDFIAYRLSGVPDIPAFHAGPWDIAVEGDETSSVVHVSIAHRVKLLPLLGFAAGAAGFADADGCCEVSVEDSLTKDEWLAEVESGLAPSVWVSRWEEKV